VYSGIETIIDAKLQNRNTHLYIKEIISYIINIVWNFALIVAVANIIAIPAFTLVETIIAILIFLLAVSQLEVLIDKKLERF
jgi:type II secretory pathway pseudopilin PulG